MPILPPSFLRVENQPPVVVPRTVTGGGATLIYCDSQTLSGYQTGDQGTFHPTDGPFNVELAARSTIFIQIEFMFSAPVSAGAFALNALGYPAGGDGYQLDSPRSYQTYSAATEQGMQATVPWTGVITRDPGTLEIDAYLSFFPQNGDSHFLGDITVSYFMAVIVGDDTGEDCLHWSSPV